MMNALAEVWVPRAICHVQSARMPRREIERQRDCQGAHEPPPATLETWANCFSRLGIQLQWHDRRRLRAARFACPECAIEAGKPATRTHGPVPTGLLRDTHVRHPKVPEPSGALYVLKSQNLHPHRIDRCGQSVDIFGRKSSFAGVIFKAETATQLASTML